MGRTHGVHAEITSFGLKWALYYDELKRDKERFLHASKNIEVIKISGAVGTFSNLSPKIQDMCAKILGLGSVNISTQVLQRDRHIEYFTSIAILATTLEKIALEIRHLQRTEVKEASEYFSKDQKGSSAKKKKKNPIGCENVMGLARVIKSYVNAIMDDNALWHERDISHSSVERIVAPDATSLIHYILKRMTGIIDQLIVYPERMLENIYLTKGIIFSGRFVNKLVEKGMSRESAYDLIQPLTFKAYEEGIMFKDLIKTSKAICDLLTDEEIEACFDYRYHLRYVDDIFKRVGIC